MLKRDKVLNWTVILCAAAIFAIISSIFVVTEIIAMKEAQLAAEESIPEPTVCYTLMDNFDDLIGEHLDDTYTAVSNISRVFWINDSEEIVPKPNESCYGEATDPASLSWLLEEARELLNGQELVFSTQTDIYPSSVIKYYLDESILVISWQQVLDDYIYTFSEIKVTHPSQFRRYLAGNEYDSSYAYGVSKMGNMVNAVLASSADFYRGRNHGIIVYQGQVMRTDFSDLVDACFIDKNGDMILVPAGEIMGMEAAQKFVDDNQIDFSLAFGPILVRDGKRCEPDKYYLGEIYDHYARAALCQKDDLHYIIVMANGKDSHWSSPDIHTFANHIENLQCKMAYTLDGGRTGTVAMNGEVLNPLKYAERWISDIIYFATAIPAEEPIITTEP